MLDIVISELQAVDAWAQADIGTVASQLSPSIGIPVPVLRVAMRSSGESYGIKPIDDAAVAWRSSTHRRHVRRAGPAAALDQGVRCDPQVRVMSVPHPAHANVLWFLPTHGDGRHLGTSIGGRDVSLNYLRQIAQAADDLGYYGVLLPTGRSCEDSWVVASALAPLTERLRYLVAVRPGLLSPTLAARMTATLDRISGGRLLINIVTGGDPVENRGDGVFLSHDERYEVTREFLAIYSELIAGHTVNFRGKHIAVDDARILFAPVQTPRPPLYFGGSSPAATEVAAESVDKYLTWGEPPAQVAEKVAQVAALADKKGSAGESGISPPCHRPRDQCGGMACGRRPDPPRQR